MTQEKKLSLTFGGFACEIVGYDDPLDLLGRIIEVFAKTDQGRTWLEAADGPAGDAARQRFAARLAGEADLDDAAISADEERLRFVRCETAKVDPRRSFAVKAPPGFAKEFEAMRARLSEPDDALAPESPESAPAPSGDPETPAPDDTLVLTEADLADPNRKRPD